MRPSWLIAAAIAIVATGWILSGQLPGSDSAEAEVKTTAVDESEPTLAKVRVDRVTAEPVDLDAVLEPGQRVAGAEDERRRHADPRAE